MNADFQDLKKGNTLAIITGVFEECAYKGRTCRLRRVCKGGFQTRPYLHAQLIVSSGLKDTIFLYVYSLSQAFAEIPPFPPFEKGGRGGI
jgi:hypothetical protein